MQNVDKAEWLKAIGAKEFPEPVKYAYTFPGYSGAFNLSERYVEESDLKELKAQYEKNKAHALEVIKAKKSEKNRNANWLALAIPKDCNYIFVCTNEVIFDERIKHGMTSLYDNRKEQYETSLPCFIGYSPTANLKDLDTLVGIPKSKKDEV